MEHQPRPLIVPLCVEMPHDGTSPLELFAALRGSRGFLLESMEGSERIARYSYIGLEPDLILTLGDPIVMEGREPFLSICREPPGRDPLEMMRSLLQRFHYVNIRAPRFFGGLVGYLAYDAVFSVLSPVLKRRRTPDDAPLARFMLAKDCIVIDHATNRLHIFACPLLAYESDPVREYEGCRRRIHEIAGRVRGTVKQGGMSHPGAPMCIQTVSRTGKEEFCACVDRVKEHILAGDIFQCVISRRIDLEPAGDPYATYVALRRINPSPYMYFLDFGKMQVVGASPEMLVRVERGRITTVPIAGTRPRGLTEEEDRQLAQELLADEKERAEHAMLVDLARNDVGRVSTFGSVSVQDPMTIERFSHVQHIVTTVHGSLRPGLDGFDVLRSCFPAGTVTGAPKLRAMQIIEELEPEGRGIYAGGVGYVGFDRNLEFAIAIRTIVFDGKKASVQTGAGIVADSVPEREWMETERKAQAMVRALAEAER